MDTNELLLLQTLLKILSTFYEVSLLKWLLSPICFPRIYLIFLYDEEKSISFTSKEKKGMFPFYCF